MFHAGVRKIKLSNDVCIFSLSGSGPHLNAPSKGRQLTQLYSCPVRDAKIHIIRWSGSRRLPRLAHSRSFALWPCNPTHRCCRDLCRRAVSQVQRWPLSASLIIMSAYGE